MTLIPQIVEGQNHRSIRMGDFFAFLSISDWTYRQTNIYLDDYNFVGGWSYVKIVWDRINLKGENQRLPFGLYLSGTIAGSNQDKPWENNYVFGIGLEKYILDDVKDIPALLKNIRLYAEYLKIGYTKQEAEEWVPDYDVRIGLDLYKDFGIGPEKSSKSLWSEIWSNLCWQKTNFFSDEYESIIFAYNFKFGLRFPRSTSISLMPYFVSEASWTSQHDFFWQNRLFLGGGLRIMPFQKAKMDLWNRFKIFAEYIRVIGHFKENPPLYTPDFDLRAGIAFSIGLWR